MSSSKKLLVAAVAGFVALFSASVFASEIFNGDFSSAAGWSYMKGAALLQDARTLSFDSDVKRGISFATYRSNADISSGGAMSISFDALLDGVVSDEPSYSCAGVVMLVEYVNSKGRTVRPKNVNLGFGTRKQARYDMVFPVEEGAKSFCVSFGLRWAHGKARLSNLRMRLDPPAVLANRKGTVAGGVNAAIVGADNAGENLMAEGRFAKSYQMDTIPAPAYEAPAIAGDVPFAFFRVDSPRRTLDRHYPHASQLQDEFKLQATAGETALLFFGIYAAGETQKLAAQTDKFGDVRPQLFRAHNWRRGYRQTPAYTLQPEVLFPLEKPQSLKKGTSALLMAKFEIPQDAMPGDYCGEIVFRAQEGERRAKVELKILPFKLRRPSPDKYEFIVHGGPYTAKGGNSRLKELFCTMKRRGFESALVPCQYAPGMLELEKDGEGRMRIKSFKKLEDALDAYRAAGMRGTFFVHFSDKLEVAVAKALGIKMADAHGEQTNMIAEMETPEFKAATVEALKLVAERCKGVPFAVLGYDEPNVASRIPRAKWEIERIEEAGITSALYCSAQAWNNVPSKIAIASVFPGSIECGKLADGVAGRGGKMYLYAYEGSYVYAFGGMHDSWGGVMPSRFTLGLSEFLTPRSSGHTAWLFGTGDAIVSDTNETAPRGWASLTRYDAKGRLLTTLQMEGDCLGVDDYAYLNTLRELLDEKQAHPKHAKVSQAFAQLQDCIRRNSYPYCLDVADAEVLDGAKSRTFVNAHADQVRSKVVELILELL